MKSMSTCLVGIENKVATVKTDKRLLPMSNTEILFFEIQKESMSAHTGDSIIETIPSMYLGFALHVEKAIVP